MKKLFFLIPLCCFLFLSCDKEDEILADPDKDYFITNIEVVSGNLNDDWDFFSSPDPYFKATMDGVNYESTILSDISSFPFRYSREFKVESVLSRFDLDIVDYDNDSADDLMARFTFLPSNNYDGNPFEVNSNNGTGWKIEVSWRSEDK